MLLSVNMSSAFRCCFFSHSIFHLSLYLSIHPSSFTRSSSRLTDQQAGDIATDSKPAVNPSFGEGSPGFLQPYYEVWIFFVPLKNTNKKG